MYDADSGELKTETSFGTSNTPDIYTQYAYTLAYNYKDATLYGVRYDQNILPLAGSIAEPCGSLGRRPV